MAYYDALVAKWATLAPGTTAQKLAAVNALTVAGPNASVAVSAVVGKLMLLQAYLSLAAFAQGSTNNNATHDTALGAAKMLMTMISIPNAPAFQMSDTTTFATVKGMMDAILAQEVAAPGSTGFTQAVHDALLALCATTIPWWQSAGYPGTFNGHDLVAAGLTTLVTNAPTAAGSNVLNFAAVPAWVIAGMEAHDLGLDQADIQPGSVVQSITATTVTISKPTTGSGIASGDVVGFAVAG
jgi:hypothetical protein